MISGPTITASAAKLPTLRGIAAAFLLAPLLCFAQQAPAPDTTAAPATAASMAGTSTAPAPAAQQTADTPRRPGETTTGRPPAPTVPAPATTPTSAAPPTAPLPGDSSIAPSTATTIAPLPPAATEPLRAPVNETPRVAMPAGSATPGAAGLLKTILALMLVLGLLAGLAWVMKRYAPNMGGGSANLRVVGALNLGGRERIMVVEVGDQWIVVGAAPGRVNALHTMPRQEGELGVAAAQGGIPATRFSDWLKNTIDKRNAT